MKRSKRSYVLKARGERQAETRARIVEAIMHLHEEVGPRNTTVSAIAERAEVERLTVYRHFPDESAMFDACSHRYTELNPPPSPELWTDEQDPALRAKRGLEAIYGYFSRTAPMFAKIYRDADEYPTLKQIMDGFDAHLRNLADDVAGGGPRDRGRARRSVILHHAVKFSTWQSLELDGVRDSGKVELMLEWLAAVPSSPVD